MKDQFITLQLRNRGNVSVPVMSGGVSCVIPPGKNPKSIKVRKKDVEGFVNTLKKRHPAIIVEVPQAEAVSQDSGEEPEKAAAVEAEAAGETKTEPEAETPEEETKKAAPAKPQKKRGRPAKNASSDKE